MASQAWLEDSLRRSAILGLEVLERASKRSVDWNSTRCSASQTGSQIPTDEDEQDSAQRTQTSLNDAFETIAEFMAQTTYQCKNFYQTHHCTEPSGIEGTHVSRFHTHSTNGTTPVQPSRKRGCVSVGEDFHIEVSPGTYSITAGMPDCRQQTQLVSLNAGESINLTFNL